MMPKFLLVNWTTGYVAGGGTEKECRTQLKEITESATAAKGDSYIIAAVLVVSEMKRVET